MEITRHGLTGVQVKLGGKNQWHDVFIVELGISLKAVLAARLFRVAAALTSTMG